MAALSYIPDRELNESHCYDWLQNGDVVFVAGRTWRSLLVRSVLGDGTSFSHVGIVRILGGLPCVIHASPGDGVVKLESAEEFLSPAKVKAAGVYRLVARGDIAAVASAAALGYFARGASFDSRFDMSSEDEIYCTELVWLAYRKAGIDLAEGEKLHESALYGKVILPANLSASARLVSVSGACVHTQRESSDF
ncbi:MAG: hypothetical protein LBT31_06975 [Synergistaceae bacterium]|nr:hypothetical protein [Synergistaceae bacterium]